MKLELTKIRTDGGTQVRVDLDQSVVVEYAEHLKEGAKFPAIVVFHDGSNYWLSDGFHRYFAHKMNGELEIECDVKQGTIRDALLYSLGANGVRGLKLNAKDIRAIIIRILKDEEWSKWSNVKIAQHVGCSHVTVSRVRHSLEEEATDVEEASEEAEEGGEEQGVTYVNKHGQKSKMKTKKIGRAKKEKAKKEPKKEEKKEEKKTNEPYQMTREEELSQKLLELTNQFNETIAENERLRDAIAVGQYDASDIEKIDVEETLKDLREQIRIKDIDIQSLRESRDTYQNRSAELMKQVKALQSKLKKAGIE